MMEKSCLMCNEKFNVSNWNKNKKYCSQECYWKDKNKSEKSCSICGKKTNNDKYCSKKCYGESKYLENVKKCDNCGKEYHNTNKNSRFCSKECYWEYRNKNKNEIFQSNQRKNLINKECEKCGKVYSVHKYREYTSKFCSKKCFYDFHNVKKVCPTCKKEFITPINESDKIYCSNSCVLITRYSKIERDIKEILSENYEIKNIKIKAKNRTLFPDIVIGDTIIEIYGDYWHCNPEIYDENYYHKQINKLSKDVWEHDKERINILKTYGYNVLIIWEKEWKENKDKTIKKIIENI
ncbi:MAG: very short patch repair endonuclease [Candidatus Muirbacterium halophilum]|nr:very short patch repair endonuclease [Candidatus Muirbacterium halophilum]